LQVIHINRKKEFIGFDSHFFNIISFFIYSKKTLLKTSAGLRPKGRGKPYLGRLTKYNNVIVASGHYKNGILLAPITGKLIAELITQDKTSLSLEPFSINQQNSSPTR